jgi:hypothetical protein
LTSCSLANENEISDSSRENIVSKEETNILYTGTVIAGGETSENSLFLSDLKPVESLNVASFDEVILLLDGVDLVDKNTGESLSVEDIKIGDTVNVLLIKDTPITMSLTAQIPGMGNLKVEVSN